MSNVVAFRGRQADNFVFRAVDHHDRTKDYSFECFRDEEDEGVYLNFVDTPGRDGAARIRDMMWINPQQCRAFGEALIKAADLAEARQS